MDALRAQVAPHGIRVGIWQQNDLPNAAQYVWSVNPDFYIANIESENEYQAFDSAGFRKAHPSLECGVVTNFGWSGDPEVQRQKSSRLIQAGFNSMGEAYERSNPQATIQNMAWESYWRGWPIDAPTVEVYSDMRLAHYADRMPHHWSAYTVEYFTDADWATARELNQR